MIVPLVRSCIDENASLQEEKLLMKYCTAGKFVECPYMKCGINVHVNYVMYPHCSYEKKGVD